MFTINICFHHSIYAAKYTCEFDNVFELPNKEISGLVKMLSYF